MFWDNDILRFDILEVDIVRIDTVAVDTRSDTISYIQWNPS